METGGGELRRLSDSLCAQEGLQLPPLQSRPDRLADEGEIRHQGAGLSIRIVLAEGHKRVIPLKADSSPYPIQPTNL